MSKGYVKNSTASFKLMSFLESRIESAKWKVVKGEDRDYKTFFIPAKDFADFEDVTSLGNIERAFVLAIPPNGAVHEHSDTHTNSYYLPVYTHKKCRKFINEGSSDVFTEYKLTSGVIYKVVRTMQHYSTNKSKNVAASLIIEVNG